MNRKEAQNHIGKLVLIDELINGRYIGKLLEVHAEPRKPWRGEIEILAVNTYPQHISHKNGEIELPKPLYKFGTIIEIESSKIELFPEEVYMKYDDSIYKALQLEIEKVQSKKGHVNTILKRLHERLAEIRPDEEVKNEMDDNTNENKELPNEYIYYTVKKEQKQIILVDEVGKQNLTLKGCPFEFELNIDGEWVPGYYVENGEFEGKDGSNHPLKLEHTVRLHKKQFDPYHILINELEKPALEALLRGLDTFELDHEQCIQCHNTLLLQLLNTHRQNKFKGVNFITYHNDQQVILVQHHYEREIIENDNDITFDRFEFTSDQGKRTITTYSNEFTKGK